MSFFAATAVVLSATPSFAATSIELTDKRSENQNGLQLIYEVRPTTPIASRAQPYPEWILSIFIPRG